MHQQELQRFEAKVQPEPNSGCWLWEASCDSSGYGTFKLANGKVASAHRASFEHFVGPVPHGKQLDHLCRARCCVNPEHLEPVTRKENVRRGILCTDQHPQVMLNRAKTHCPSGHPYSGENLVIRKNGHRRCRTCTREQSKRKYWERMKARREV